MDTHTSAVKETAPGKVVLITEGEARAIVRGLWGRTSSQIAKYLAAQDPDATASAYDLKNTMSMKADTALFAIRAMRQAGLVMAAPGGGRLKRRPYILTQRGKQFAALCKKLEL